MRARWSSRQCRRPRAPASAPAARWRAFVFPPNDGSTARTRASRGRCRSPSRGDIPRSAWAAGRASCSAGTSSNPPIVFASAERFCCRPAAIAKIHAALQWISVDCQALTKFSQRAFMSAPQSIEHIDVLIVGAGLSGIGAGYHLQTNSPQRSYAIFEGREDIGGTWDLFRYPGIRSDSDMYTLGYSFRPWTLPKAIADGPSILEYVRDTA